MDSEIRNFYGIRAANDNRYDEHTLSLMMTTDALFILDFMYRLFVAAFALFIPIYVLPFLVLASIRKIIEITGDSGPVVIRISKAIRVINRVLLLTWVALCCLLWRPLLIWLLFTAYVELRLAGRAHHISFPRVCTATKLNQVGIDFETLSKDTHQITYEDNTLVLPRIMISRDATEVILRNLLALEACGRPDKAKTVTAYVDLMATLIDTAEDAAMLRRFGIIYPQNDNLTDEDIARIWKSLLKPFSAAYFKPPQHLVNLLSSLTLRKRRRSEWETLLPCTFRVESLRDYWEEFKGRYLSRPWLTASPVGGILVILMTAAQVFCLFYECSSERNS